MRRYDLTPLLRSSVGFDRLDRLFDAVTRADATTTSYPPYNIEKTGDDNYRISMAVAGFAREDLDVNVNEGVLIVKGNQAEEKAEAVYLHRGIAARAFERRFQLADNVRVVAANIENGLLHIDLVREVPEHKRPRQIEITAANGAEVAQQAA